MKVSIIGAAGSVGAPVAFYIAVSGLAEEIVMIDVRSNMVRQHAMDISTAASALDVRVKDGGYEDLAGSDVIINAAGVFQGLIADRMELLPKNIPLVRDIALEIKRHCPAAIVITATNPVDPLNYATWRVGGFDRHRLIGYSVNDSFRFRELVARAKGVRVSQVQATVIGEHGSSQVPLFSSVRVDGRPMLFTEDEKQSHSSGNTRHPETIRSAANRADGRLDLRGRCGGDHARHSAKHGRDVPLFGSIGWRIRPEGFEHVGPGCARQGGCAGDTGMGTGRG